MAMIFLSCIKLLSACTILGVAKVSEPWIADVGDAKFTKDMLVYSDISVSVKPQNYYTTLVAVGPIIPIIPAPGRSRASEKDEFFVVVVQFETEGDGYAFDPNRVLLKYIDDNYRPISVRGPFIGGGDISAQEVGSAVPGHRWRCLHPNGEVETGFRIRPLAGKVCFELKFGIHTIPPAENFNVVLDGSVKKSSVALRLPTFNFRPALRSKFGLLTN